MSRCQRTEGATLATNLDEQGRLAVTQPDGTVTTQELFLKI